MEEEVTAVTPISEQVLQAIEPLPLNATQRMILQVVAESSDEPDKFITPHDVIEMVRTRFFEVVTYEDVTTTITQIEASLSQATLQIVWQDDKSFCIGRIIEDFSEGKTGTIDTTYI